MMVLYIIIISCLLYYLLFVILAAIKGIGIYGVIYYYINICNFVDVINCN